jgi:lipopolysaccharide transport system permease protein
VESIKEIDRGEEYEIACVKGFNDFDVGDNPEANHGAYPSRTAYMSRVSLIKSSHLNELWSYRELIIRLAWSDFKLRYKSSALGFLWSLLEPLLMLLVLYTVFSNLMRVQVEHYQLFLLLGIILWNFLDRGTSMGIWSIVGKPSLVQKVYFSRDVLVISTCITALMMTILEFAVFIIFLAIFRVVPGWTVAYFPILFLLEFLIILGLSMALSALNVYFRDVQFIWRLVVQVGFFATPILYPITIFPENVRWIVMLNPLAQLITMMRDCTLYEIAPMPMNLAFAAISMLFILLIGYIIFGRLEPNFAEAI